MSSAAYWADRYENSPTDKYNTSWPDRGMRALELFEIYRYLTTSCFPNARILELGCGMFTLDEFSEVVRVLEEIRGLRYLGLDSSHEALMVAEAALDNTMIRGEVEQCDITDGVRMKKIYEDFRPTHILSRRVIQNLEPAEQLRLVAGIPDHCRGIFLEGTMRGAIGLDTYRHSCGLPPLPRPSFNWPLDRNVTEIFDDRGFRTEYPFSQYYRFTRCHPPHMYVGQARAELGIIMSLQRYSLPAGEAVIHK